jgi:predicted Na+-dependent transporter
MKATFILAIISIFFAIASVYLAISGVSLVILIVAVTALIITSIPYFYLSRKNKQKKAKEQS